MLSRLKTWQLGALLAALTGIAIGFLEFRSKMGAREPARLLEALPLKGAVTGYLDVGKLRRSGVLDQLAGNKTLEDPEYRNFAEQIGFDYRTDLDAVAAAYTDAGLYAAMRGRFNWQKLSAYAIAQKGQCTEGICSMPASRPNQIISFELISGDVLGWAVDEHKVGVEDIVFAKYKATALPSSATVFWIAAPGASFKDPTGVPTGTRAFLTPLSAAQDASFSFRPAEAGGSGAAAKFEIRLDASCASADVATQLASVLTQTTDLLRSLVVKDKLTPDNSSLTGLLLSGHFQSRAASVTGTWPMDQKMIQNLISGEIK